MALTAIKTLSEQSGLSAAAALYAFGIERVLLVLSAVDETGAFVLRNDRAVLRFREGARTEQTLRFYYADTVPLTESRLSAFFETFSLQAKMMDAAVSGHFVTETPALGGIAPGSENEAVFVYAMDIRIDDMYVPLVWEITQKTTEIFRHAATHVSVFSPDTEIPYFREGTEEVVLSHLFPILEKLELLGELEHYLELYLLLGEASVEGRRMAALLQTYFSERGVTLDAARLSLWKGYREYAYMKKRWKVLLRRQGRAVPSWENCMDRLIAFTEPLLEAAFNGRAFFGDWMPGLLRYLE